VTYRTTKVSIGDLIVTAGDRRQPSQVHR